MASPRRLTLTLLALSGCNGGSTDLDAATSSSESSEPTSSGGPSSDATSDGSTTTTGTTELVDESSGDTSGDVTADASTSTTDTDTGAAPAPVDDVLYTLVDQPLVVDAPGVLANDVGEGLVVINASDETEAGGTIVVGGDGSLVYTPPAGYWGSDTAVYEVTDGSQDASATISLHVAATTIELSDVAEERGGFAIDGSVANGSAGRAVSGAGDVNGDGFADVIVGTPFAAHTAEFSGRAYVVFGGDAPQNVSLAGLDDGFVLEAEATGGRVGLWVGSAGDVNGDALDDVVVGSLVGGGRVYVVFGKADASPVDLADIVQGIGGFAIDADPATGSDACNGAGDVNGDGFADIIVGASGSELAGPDAGRASVVYGGPNVTGPVSLADVADGVGGFAIDGFPSSLAGFAVSRAGDINGDGLDDVLVGGPSGQFIPNDRAYAYVVFGSDQMPALVDPADLELGIGGFVIEHGSAGPASSVSPAGDFNGDGRDDLLIGSSGSLGAYLVFGSDDVAPLSFSDLQSGMGGFIVAYDELEYSNLGYAVGGAGDVNGDGFSDLVVGAFGFPELEASGATYVVFGTDDVGNRIDPTDLALGDGGFALAGEAEDDWSGYAVGIAGDVNGDGLADVIVGAPSALANDRGRTYVVFGFRAQAG